MTIEPVISGYVFLFLQKDGKEGEKGEEGRGEERRGEKPHNKGTYQRNTCDVDKTGILCGFFFSGLQLYQWPYTFTLFVFEQFNICLVCALK